VSGARRARAQAKPIKIGTASALADHAEVDLKGRFMLLSGSVRVKMPGQVDEKETIVTADSMRLAMGTNPVTKKPDLAAITADGHVHFNASQTVPNKDGKPMQRTIDGSSDKAVLHRFEQRAELTGNVTVTSDDAEQKVTSSGAGSATVDLKAGTVAAHKAEGGPQVSIQWESKVPAAPKKAK
jgi:lipopolysaccharide export system protein LptA